MSEIDNPYAPPATPAAEGVAVYDGDDRLGWAILAIPAAAGVIGPLLMIVSPELGTFIGVPVLVATLVLVSKDAPRWGLKPSHQVLGLLFLWLIYFPVYFHRRSRKGAPPRVVHAIASMLMYLGGFVALGFVQALLQAR